VKLSARPIRALVLIAWSGFFVSLWIGGEADRYLGPRTTWVVTFGAITLSVAALAYGVLALRDTSRKHLTRWEATGYLALLLPILAVLIVPRAELGAQAARKKSTNRSLGAIQKTAARQAAAKAAAKAASDQRDPVAKIDFLSVATVTTDPSYASDIAVKSGTRVRLVGFVVRSDQHDRFRLTRFLISCCAADAVPVFVEVKAMGDEIPEDNAWLEVTGRLVKRQGWFLLQAQSMITIRTPEKPYLTTWGY
jgi:putative membrane protein